MLHRTAAALLLLASTAHAQPAQVAPARDMHWIKLAQNSQRILYYSGDHIDRWRGSDGKLYASTNFRTDVIGAIGQSLLIDVDQVRIPCSSERPNAFTVVTSTNFKGNWDPTGDLSDESSANRSYEVPMTQGSAMVGITQRLCAIIQTAGHSRNVDTP